MNSIQKTFIKLLGKPKIVHSIPGRLRINIWGLKNNPEYVAEYADALIGVLKSKNGISDVSLNQYTGNVLVEYTPKNITESEITCWIDTAWQTVLDSLKTIENPDDERKLVADICEKLSKLG